MAKRFIDTDLFNDSWFMDLSQQAKLLWIYLITQCDHAGIIELNKKLLNVQTGIKDFDTVKEELGNRLVRVKEQYYFIPKFIKYQYPDFPKSTVKTQASAIKILKEFNLLDNSSLTVREELDNSYGNGYGNGNGNGNGNAHLSEKHSDDSTLSVSKDTNSIFTFEEFWNLYDKKESKLLTEKKYSKISEKDRELIKKTLPAYINKTPDKQFRKNPLTYLNSKLWLDEPEPEKKQRVILTKDGIKFI